MAARIETATIHRGVPRGSVVIAVVTALVLGGLAGTLITRSVVDATGEPASVGVATWDAGRLDAMSGRQLAAVVSAASAAAGAWDAEKVQAMEGRQLAAAFADQPGTVATEDGGTADMLSGRELAAR
jgi:hypothetical protein